MTPHYILDRLDEAPRVVLDVGLGVSAALNRNLVAISMRCERMSGSRIMNTGTTGAPDSAAAGRQLVADQLAAAADENRGPSD